MLEAPWHEYVGWGALAIVKFIITPSAMIASGYSWLETFLTVSIAAAIGSVVFYFFGDLIFKTIARLNKKPARRFTPLNRRVVRMKSKYGLKGLGFIAGLISVPIAGLMTARFFHNPYQALSALVVSFTLWTTVFTSLSWALKYMLHG